MKKIVLTGGGTAGHVIPNLALIPRLRQEGWQIYYIGSYQGIEKELIMKTGIPYYQISAGKLRRYLDFNNFLDPFKVIKGLWQAFFILGKIKPEVVFSKGGFVTVPVVIAAWLRKIPVVIHESDISPGLANKIALPFASKVCVSFPETQKYIPVAKTAYTGTPIREELLKGNKEKGLKICGFNKDLPVIMVIGGSLGSEKINKAIRQVLPELLKKFQVIHICGKRNVDNEYRYPGYCQFEYVDKDLAHIFALADLVISRAGATSIFEILALRKPHVLIPLSKEASRGDQILNARSFAGMGYSRVLFEEEMTAESLLSAIQDTWKNKVKYITAMEKSPVKDSV